MPADYVFVAVVFGIITFLFIAVFNNFLNVFPSARHRRPEAGLVDFYAVSKKKKNRIRTSSSVRIMRARTAYVIEQNLRCS